MIGKHISVNLDGLIYAAFAMYCRINELKNGREGIENLIRQLPQYKQLLAMNHSDDIEQDQNQEPNPSESLAQPACAG